MIGGKLLGMDGIGSGRHEVQAVALEESQICIIPFTELERLPLALTALAQELHRVMSRKIVRREGMMLLLGSRHLRSTDAVGLQDVLDGVVP